MTPPSKNPRTVALEVLLAIETQSAFSHIALDAALRRHELPPRDRSLATCIVYGTLAWQRRLDTELASALRGDLQRDTEPLVRVALRAALFQLRHLDRVPAHAVLHEAVDEIKRRRGPKMGGLVNAVLRKLSRSPAPQPNPSDSPAAQLAAAYSLPDALAAQAIERLGPDEAQHWAATMNTPPPLTVRVNRSLAGVEDIASKLAATPGRWVPSALRLQHGLDPDTRAAIDQGFCAIQDEGSQLVTLFAGPLPDGPIWDACAGQGGKTAHLADLLRTEPRPNAALWATDLHPSKLKRLQRTALFEGLTLHVEAADARTWSAPCAFPLVLLDAPCSGLGLMRRHPETRWRRPQDIEALAALQSQLLDAAARAVAPGGLLLYAVCTTTPEETALQIDRFLERFPEFLLEGPPPTALPWAALVDARGCLSLAPYPHDTDGFFAARLRRAAHKPPPEM